MATKRTFSEAQPNSPENNNENGGMNDAYKRMETPNFNKI